jgi:hypothetical protein
VVGWGIVRADASPHCLFRGNIVGVLRADGFMLQRGGEHALVLWCGGSWPSWMVGVKG